MRYTIVIPGLGIGFLTKLQKAYVSRWNTKSRVVKVFEPRWNTTETSETKFARLTELLAEIENPDKLTVIGYSAGGPLVIALLDRVPNITEAHIISGKNKGASGIGELFRKRAPALVSSVQTSEKILHKKPQFTDKVTIYRPLLDETVPLRDMVVPGAREHRIPMIGHVVSIIIALVFMVPRG